MATATPSQAEQSVAKSVSAAMLTSPTTLGLAAVALVTLGHLPLVVTYFRRLLLFEHYQFVPLVLIGVPALMIARMRAIPRSAWRRGFPNRALLISCGTLAVASLFCSPWAAMVSLVLSLGLFLRFYAGPHWRTLLPVWALLLLIIRPPLHLDLSLITTLQIETSKVSSIVLENLGVKHLMDGNVLVIPQRRFLVEEACSGINSVFALLTASAFYAVFVHASVVRAALLISSAVFWACFMNLVRVAATIFAFEQLRIDLGEGLAHTIAGMVTFGLAVLFVAFTDQVVRFFLDPIDQRSIEFWEQRRNPFVRWWNRTRPAIVDEPEATVATAGSEGAPASAGVPAMAVTTTLVIGGIALIAAGWQVLALQAESDDNQAPATIAALEANSIPATLGDWSQTGYEIERRKKNAVLGDVSKIWTYRAASYSAIVSVDYPFRGWHKLSACYQGQGWQIDEYHSVPLPVTDDGRRTAMTEAIMHQPSGEQALLMFVVMDRRGRPLQDPSIGSFARQIAVRAVERLKRPLALRFPELAPSQGVTTQLQMLIATDGDPITSDVRDEAREHFITLQAQLADRLASDSGAASEGDRP